MPIHRADGRVIGQVRSGVFRKRIHSGLGHLLRTPLAICFDLESLAEAEDAAATTIRIEDADTGRVYAIAMVEARRQGFIIRRGGFTAQLAVPLSAWAVSGRAVPVQLALFAEGRP